MIGEAILGLMLLVSLFALAISLVVARKCRAALTETEATLKDVTESEARFQAIAENIPQMAWISRSDGTTIWQNRRWFEYTGMQKGAENWEDYIHPNHVHRVAKGMNRSEKAQTVFEDTFPIKGKDGTYRWFLSRAIPIPSRDGQALYFGTDTDITENVESSERLKLLMREVDHRSKNLLEIVQSVVALTRSDNIDDFSKAITKRIASLGRTQSLLAHQKWKPVELGDAILAQLSPVLDIGDATRLSISGPETYLHAKTRRSAFDGPA